MDSSAGNSELAVIRIGERYIGNWPAEVRQAVAVLTAFVEQSLAAEANGADAAHASGPALREAAESAAKQLADAEAEHPGEGAGAGDDAEPRSACGAVDAGPAPAAGAEIVLVRGRNAYETVSRAVG